MPKIAYFTFIQRSRTNVWGVNAKGADYVPLGIVKWYGRWRCYAFFPEVQTVFEKQCLRDIADFCEEQTDVHRKARLGV